MGLWRIGFGLYGEEETWIPDRGVRSDWPDSSDFPPCDICVGCLTRRRYQFAGKDGQQYSGYRYQITHYGKAHDRYKAVYHERRKTA